jgi:hypothetical protein
MERETVDLKALGLARSSQAEVLRDLRDRYGLVR